MNSIKITNKIIVIIFCAFVFGMAAFGILLPKDEFSEVENRYLEKMPKLETEKVLDGRFMNDFDDFISDHTPLRDKWVQIKAGLEKMSGKHENEGVAFASDDTLIELYTVKNPNVALKNVSYVNEFKSCYVPVYLGLIPTAADIWKDKLEKGAPTVDEKALINDLYSDADEEITTIDMYGALEAHKDEYIYFRTDHHWTSIGALYGANALLKSMGMEEISEDEIEKKTVSSEFIGTLWSTAGAYWTEPDEIYTFVGDNGLDVEIYNGLEPEEGSLYVDSYLDKKDKYSYFLGGNAPICVIKTGNEGPKLLLIRDSYSSSMVPYLTLRFSEIHLVDLRYTKMSMQDYVIDYDLDVAAVVYGIKTFTEDTNPVVLTQ